MHKAIPVPFLGHCLVRGCASTMLCYHVTLVSPVLSGLQLQCKHLHPARWCPEHPVPPGAHRLHNTVGQAAQEAQEKRYVGAGDASCSGLCWRGLLWPSPLHSRRAYSRLRVGSLTQAGVSSHNESNPRSPRLCTGHLLTCQSRNKVKATCSPDGG